MKNIIEYAKICLQHTDIAEKLALTQQAWQLAQTDELDFIAQELPDPIAKTQFPQRPQLLLPKYMPKRNLNTPQGLAAMFHALVHIEFIAIYLAWDIIYRFPGMPAQFYKDWLQVAHEEAEHFALLRQHLRTMDVDYGDLPAHHGLWQHAEDTADNLLARLAIVPRCMEARGLDVTPGLIKKLTTVHDAVSVSLLERILADEIQHVAYGSYWFQFLCQQQGYNSEEKYQSLLGEFYKGKPKGPFNRELRLKAGFSNADCDWLDTL